MDNTRPLNHLESPEGPPKFKINLNDGTEEFVSIIVVHRNRPEFLNICIQSICALSNTNNYELIVVDNASDQETQEYLDVLQIEGIKVIRNQENKMWSAAANQGAAVSNPAAKYLLFMHADTVVLDPSWIDILVNISAAKGSGLVGTRMKSCLVNKQQTQFLEEWCLLISKACWEDCGPWAEELPLVGMSLIMTYAAQLKGYKPITSGNALVHHYESFSGDPNEYEQFNESSRSVLPKLLLKVRP